MASVPTDWGSAGATGDGRGDRSSRIDRMSPVFHELIDSGLMTRTDTGQFTFCDEVQQRLAAMSDRRHSSVPNVYVGRLCQACGERAITRMVQGFRLCARCADHGGDVRTDADR